MKLILFYNCTALNVGAIHLHLLTDKLRTARTLSAVFVYLLSTTSCFWRR